ncbi:MAG: hypothetical protein AABX51_05410 [Nanoarchaeota archaeon]
MAGMNKRRSGKQKRRELIGRAIGTLSKLEEKVKKDARIIDRVAEEQGYCPEDRSALVNIHYLFEQRRMGLTTYSPVAYLAAVSQSPVLRGAIAAHKPEIAEAIEHLLSDQGYATRMQDSYLRDIRQRI